MEGKGEETVKDTLAPVKTQYLVIDNGGKIIFCIRPFRLLMPVGFGLFGLLNRTV